MIWQGSSLFPLTTWFGKVSCFFFIDNMIWQGVVFFIYNMIWQSVVFFIYNMIWQGVVFFIHNMIWQGVVFFIHNMIWHGSPLFRLTTWFGKTVAFFCYKLIQQGSGFFPSKPGLPRPLRASLSSSLLLHSLESVAEMRQARGGVGGGGGAARYICHPKHTYLSAFVPQQTERQTL